MTIGGHVTNKVTRAMMASLDKVDIVRVKERMVFVEVGLFFKSSTVHLEIGFCSL
jgi:hypothetical protein